ncbi:hypothetical protein IC582_016363 [Cucumis melo]
MVLVLSLEFGWFPPLLVLLIPFHWYQSCWKLWGLVTVCGSLLAICYSRKVEMNWLPGLMS